MPIRYESS
jgi:hypothetical protein